MTPKPTGWDELHLAEDPAVELLKSLGYTCVQPEDLEPERASLKEAVLTGRLAAALRRLNPWLSETNVAKAVKAVTQVPAASLAEANEKLYTSLTYGIALEQDRGGGRKSHTVRFLDFEQPDLNEWIVTRQYRVLGSKKHVIPDVVAFVNGLPLAIIECKSPTIGDAWKAEAVKQLRRYQEADSRWKGQGAPRLFEAAQVLVGTCGERSVYGTVGTPERFFLEWKEPYTAPRRGAAAAGRGHRHRPHEARPADRRGVHRVRVPEPRAGGQRARPAAHPRASDRRTRPTTWGSTRAASPSTACSSSTDR